MKKQNTYIASKISSNKKLIVSNNHICLSKRIVNKPDENYLNLTQHKLDKYKSHLENGGTMSMSIEKFKNGIDKKTNKLECRYVVTINSLRQLGFRDKKNSVYRVKITGIKEKLDKIGKRDVLAPKNGGKNQFEQQLNYGVEQLDTKNHKTVVDGFCGGGGFTLKNIEKMSFDRYIMNDLDFYQYTVFLAIKKDYSKVIKIFTQLNDDYLSLIPDELREYEKSYVKNKCKSKSTEYYKRKELRNNNLSLKEYYEKCVKQLENKTLDIYTLSALYIFIMGRTFNGIFEYKKDGSIDETSFNWSLTPRNKVHMIKHWGYLFAKYNVEIANKDIFDLLKELDSDSTLYLDVPYLDCKDKTIYNSDNSDNFQIKVLNETKRFHRILYSNENCKALYDLKIDTYFHNNITFARTNNMKRLDKKVGGEFLGFRNEPLLQFVANNKDYIPTKNQFAA